MKLQDLSKKIFELVGKNKILPAIKELTMHIQDGKSRGEALMLLSDYKELQRKMRIGIIDHQNASISRNTIVANILEILSSLEEDAKDDLEEQEENKGRSSIITNKNHLSSNQFHVGRDMYIGDTNSTKSNQAEEGGGVSNEGETGIPPK